MSQTPTGANPEPDDARPPTQEELREALTGGESAESPDDELSDSDAAHFAEDHLTLDSGIAEAAREESATFEAAPPTAPTSRRGRRDRSAYGDLLDRLEAAARGDGVARRVVDREPKGSPDVRRLERKAAGLRRLGVPVELKLNESGSITVLYATVSV